MRYRFASIVLVASLLGGCAHDPWNDIYRSLPAEDFPSEALSDWIRCGTEEALANDFGAIYIRVNSFYYQPELWTWAPGPDGLGIITRKHPVFWDGDTVTFINAQWLSSPAVAGSEHHREIDFVGLTSTSRGRFADDQPHRCVRIDALPYQRAYLPRYYASF